MNLDRLQNFPNQNAEHRGDECVAETIADLLGNIYYAQGVKFDPGFNYGATFDLNGLTPSNVGTNPTYAFYAQCYRGSLPIQDATFTALTTSELMEANFNAYPPEQHLQALAYRQRGVRRLYSYTDIQSALKTYGQGVGMAMVWPQSFLNPNPDGTLPKPDGLSSNPMVAVYEDVPGLGLRIKPWLGSGYGAGGYCFLNETQFNQLFIEAFCFDPTANPLYTSLSITYYQLLATFNRISMANATKS
jgi:hypothetical protein